MKDLSLTKLEETLLTKEEIKDISKKFDYTADITEEEFESQLQILGSYLLKDTKWAYNDGHVIPKQIPVLYDTYLICKGEDCKFAAQCPVIKNMSYEQINKLKGTKCRLDAYTGTTTFAAVTKDLDVHPGQTIDILAVANICRWMCYRTRIDMQIRQEDMTFEAVTTINQSTGQVYGETKSNPLLKELYQIDKQIEMAQKSLLASRKDRVGLALQIGSEKEALKAMLTFSGLDEEE